ncbi:MAG: RluA family pseudouridine synthase [Pirellulaceae bacterium]
MAYKTVAATVDEQSAGRIDLIVRDLTELTRSQVRGIVDHGCVTVNEALCSDAGHQVMPGDIVSVTFDPHRRYKEKKRSWDDRTFEIVFEDDYLIVVNKAAGTLTVPTDNDDANTLMDRVSTYLNHSRRNKVAWVVHRLDRDISGLLVFAKQELISAALIEQFKIRKPRRVYTAIVSGVIADEAGLFNVEPLTTEDRRSAKPDNKAQKSTDNDAQSEDAEELTTQCNVLARYRDTTFVEVELNSGKRIHIREALSEAGHPVLGDVRYGDEQATHPRWIRKRIALHARSLSIVHPVTNQPITFDSPLPSAMEKFISGSKRDNKPTDKAPTLWDQARVARKQTPPRQQTLTTTPAEAASAKAPSIKTPRPKS